MIYANSFSFDDLPFLLEECFKQLILGVIQGLTEFLPISSTAHLKVIPVLLGWGDPGVSVTAAIQLGSAIAVLFYFWKDLSAVFDGFSSALYERSWFHPKARLGYMLIFGTFPILIAGFCIKSFWPGYELSHLRTLNSIAIVSLLMAFVLFLGDRLPSTNRSLENVNGNDALIIGLAQILALIPGVSRSGITITAGLFRGWDNNSAARFSFLLGIPAITLSALVEINEAFSSTSLEGFLPLLIGISSAAFTSWLSIDFLLRFLRQNSIMIFVIYRFFFGVSLLFWLYLSR